MKYRKIYEAIRRHPVKSVTDTAEKLERLIQSTREELYKANKE